VYIPDADYLLAMKVLAARVDTMDKKDIQFLIHEMGIQSAAEVFSILEAYYPTENSEKVCKPVILGSAYFRKQLILL
jgi:hypothetical protein